MSTAQMTNCSYLHLVSPPSCISSVMKNSISMDSSDQKKTRMKLKKFLIRRPTYQAVRDKGYIKGEHPGCILRTSILHSHRYKLLSVSPQTRCLAAVWAVCVSGRTRRYPTSSRCASTTWRTQVQASRTRSLNHTDTHTVPPRIHPTVP